MTSPNNLAHGNSTEILARTFGFISDVETQSVEGAVVEGLRFVIDTTYMHPVQNLVNEVKHYKTTCKILP